MGGKLNLSLFLILVLVLMASCGDKSDSTSTEGENSELPNEIVIGNIGALSGPSAVLGKAQTQGVELAVKEINEMGGILGSEIKIVTRDDKADPTTSKTLMEELVNKEKANFIIGPTNSTPASASISYLQEKKIISILPIATDTSLISKENPYAFRLIASNALQAERLVDLAIEGGYKNIALVADTSALGTDGMKVMEENLVERGVEAAVKATYHPNEEDMSHVAQKIIDAEADVALFWTLGADGAKIVRALERLDYINNLDIIGYTGIIMPNFKELAGPGADKATALSFKDWALDEGADKLSEKYWNFYQKVIDEYGEFKERETVPTMVALAYDAVYLLKWAIEKAGTIDPDEVKKILETEIDDFDSVVLEEGYNFSEESHEGYKMESLVKVKITEMMYDDLYIKQE